MSRQLCRVLSAVPCADRREEAALARLRTLLAGVSRLPEYTVRLVRADPDSTLHIALDIVLSTHAVSRPCLVQPAVSHGRFTPQTRDEEATTGVTCPGILGSRR